MPDQQAVVAVSGWKRWKRRLRRIAFVLITSYLGVFLLLILLERRLIFRPTKAGEEWLAPPEDIHANDVKLATPKGDTVHAWWCAPDGWSPSQGALLYCHGNAGNLSHRGERIRALQESLGVAVLIFDYPGYGHSTGKPSEKECYAAAEAARAWLIEEQRIDPERLILFGRSLGGAVAVELATRHPFRALVIISGFTSVPDVAAKTFPWLPARPFIRNRFESQKKIPRCNGPVFIAHGTADSIIPFAMGERLFAACNEPKRFVRLDGLNHNDRIGRVLFAELNAFLAEAER